MKDAFEEQAELALWVNKEARIVTFRAAEGFVKRVFRTQEEKMSYVCALCEFGYRIL